MITLKNTVKSLLSSLTATVWFDHPQNLTTLPCITWRETRNRELHQADGHEHLAELQYTVDVWSNSPATTQSLSADVDRVMTASRFRRDYAADSFTDNLFRRTLRYRCVADAQNNIYQ